MKRVSKIFIMLLMLAACSVTFLSCGEKEISGVSLSLPQENSIVYVNDEFDIDVSLSPKGAKVKDLKWSSSDSLVASVDNGKVKAQRTGSVTITATSKNNSSIKGSVTFEIYQRNESFQIGKTTVNYTGTTPVINIVSPANLQQDRITFSYATKGSALTFLNGLPINIGEYVIKASLSGQSGFCFADLSILPATATVSIGTYEKVYLNNFDSEEIVIQKTGFINNDSNLLNGSFLIDGKAITEQLMKSLVVGQYAITINQTSTALNNYNITVNNGTLNVVKRDVVIHAENSEMFYKQWSNPTIDFSILDGEEDDVINDLSTYKNKFTGSLSWEGNTLSAGNYEINQGTLTSDSFNITGFVSATFNIKKQPITITPKSANVSYGSIFNKENIQYTIVGLRQGDIVSNVFKLAPIVNTSSYNIQKDDEIKIMNNGQDVTGNYDITVVAGASVTYNTGTIELVIPSIERAYEKYTNINSLIPEVSNIVVKVNGEVPQESPLSYNAGRYSITWDDVSYSLTLNTEVVENTEGSNIYKKYRITAALDSAAANYFTASVNTENGQGCITIKKIDVTVKIGDFQKTYGGVNPTFTYNVSGLLEDDDQNDVIIIETEGGNVENVGDYILTAKTNGEKAYYNLTVEKGLLKILPKEITVTAEEKSKTYGGNDPVLEYTCSELANEDTENTVFSGVLRRVAGENVGTYTINQGTLSAGSNYTVNYVSSIFTINKKGITVRPSDGLSKFYGDNDPALTYTYSGLVNNDNSAVFRGSLTRATGEAVNTYTINQGTLSAGNNYAITFTSSAFTINQKQITVSIVSQEYALGIVPSTNVLYTASGLKSSDSLEISSFGTLNKVSNDYYVSEDFDFSTATVTESIAGGNTNNVTSNYTFILDPLSRIAFVAVANQGVVASFGTSNGDNSFINTKTINYNDSIPASVTTPVRMKEVGTGDFNFVFTGENADQIKKATYTITYYKGTETVNPSNVGIYRAVISNLRVYNEGGINITSNYSEISIISPSLIISKINDPNKETATSGLSYNGEDYSSEMGVSVQYGTLLREVVLEKEGYDISWKNGLQSLNMGENTCIAIFESTTGNYNTFEQELKVTLTKRVIDSSAAVTFILAGAGSQQYTGNEFVDHISVENISGQYDLFDLSSIYDITYEYGKYIIATSTTQITIGETTYTIGYTAGETPLLTLTDGTTVITATDETYITIDGTAYTIGQTAETTPRLTLTPFTADYPILPGEYKTKAIFTIKEQYRNYYTFISGENATEHYFISGEYTITKATPSVSSGITTFTYNGEEQQPTFTLYFNGENITESVTENINISIQKDDGSGEFVECDPANISKNAGRYKMAITITGHSLYTLERSIIFNILQKNVIITIEEPGYYEYNEGNTHINLETSVSEGVGTIIEKYYQGKTIPYSYSKDKGVYASATGTAVQDQISINGGEFILFSVESVDYIYYGGAFYMFEGQVGVETYTGAENAGAYVCYAYIDGENYSGSAIKPFVINKKIIRNLSLRTSMTIDQGEYYPTGDPTDENCRERIEAFFTDFVSQVMVNSNYKDYAGTLTFSSMSNFKITWEKSLSTPVSINILWNGEDATAEQMLNFMKSLVGTGASYQLITYTATQENYQNFTRTVQLYINPTIVTFNQNATSIFSYNGNVQMGHVVMSWSEGNNVRTQVFNTLTAGNTGVYSQTFEGVNVTYYTYEVNTATAATITATNQTNITIGGKVYVISYVDGLLTLRTGTESAITATNNYVITIGTETFLIGQTTTGSVSLLTLTKITPKEPRDAGKTYAVVAIIDLTESMKYKMAGTAKKLEMSYTFVIAPAQYSFGEISENNRTFVYSGTAVSEKMLVINNLSLTGTVVDYYITQTGSGLKVGVSYYKDTDTSRTNSISPINVGKYVAVYKVATNSAYKFKDGENDWAVGSDGYYSYEVGFEIKAYQLQESNFNITGASTTYDGAQHTITATFKESGNAKFSGKTIVISYNGFSSGSPRNAGEYSFTISVYKNGIADDSLTDYNGTLTIGQKTISSNEIITTISKEYTAGNQNISKSELIKSGNTIIAESDFNIATQITIGGTTYTIGHTEEPQLLTLTNGTTVITATDATQITIGGTTYTINETGGLLQLSSNGETYTSAMTNVGTYDLTINGTGNFQGSLTVQFTINNKILPADEDDERKAIIEFKYGSLNILENINVTRVALWSFNGEELEGVWAFATSGNGDYYTINGTMGLQPVENASGLATVGTLKTISQLNALSVQEDKYSVNAIFIPNDTGYLPILSNIFVRVKKAEYLGTLEKADSTFDFPEISGYNGFKNTGESLLYSDKYMGVSSKTTTQGTLTMNQGVTLSDGDLLTLIQGSNFLTLTNMATEEKYIATDSEYITIGDSSYTIVDTGDLLQLSAGQTYTASSATQITIGDNTYIIGRTAAVVTIEEDQNEYYLFKLANGGTLTPTDSVNYKDKDVDIYIKVKKPGISEYLLNPKTRTLGIVNGETIACTVQDQIKKEDFFINSSMVEKINFTIFSNNVVITEMPTSLGTYSIRFELSSVNGRIKEEEVTFNFVISAGRIITKIEEVRTDNYMFIDELLPQITWNVTFEEAKKFENIYFKGETEVFKYAYNAVQEKWMWTTDGENWSDEQPVLTEGFYTVRLVDSDNKVKTEEFLISSYSFTVVDKTKITVNDGVSLAYGETFDTSTNANNNSKIKGINAFKYTGTAFTTTINGASIDALSTDVIFNNSAVKLEYVDYVKFTISSTTYYFYYSKEVATITDGTTTLKFYRKTSFTVGAVTLYWGTSLTSDSNSFEVNESGKIFTYGENKYIYITDTTGTGIDKLYTFTGNTKQTEIPAVTGKSNFYYYSTNDMLFEVADSYAKVYTTYITNGTAYVYVDVILTIGKNSVEITSIAIPVKLATEVRVLNIAETYSGKKYNPEYKKYYKAIRYENSIGTYIEVLIDFGDITELPTFTYSKNGTTVSEIIDAGEYAIDIGFQKNGYSDFNNTISIRINKAIATIIPKTTTFTYNDGSAVPFGEFVTIVGINGEEVTKGISYSYNKDGNSISANSIINVGEYSVVVRVDDINYVGENTIEINVKKKDTTLIVPTTSSNTFIYTGETFNIVVPKLYTASGNIVVNLSYSPALSSIVDAGTYNITATYDGDDNLNGCNVDFVVVVLPKEVAMTFTNVEHTYTGTALSATVETDEVVGNYSVTYWQNGVQVSEPTNAGVYDIEVSFESDNYIFTKEKEMIIKKAKISILWDVSNTYSYGQKTIPAAVIYTGTTPLVGEEITYEYNGNTGTLASIISAIKNGQNIFPVGTYEIVARYTESDNYFGSEKLVKLNIAKAPPTISINTEGLYYTGSMVVPTVTVTGLGSEVIPLTSLNITYQENNGDVAGASIASPTAVGWYKIIVKISADNGNYQGEKEEMFQIQKQELVLEIGDLTCEYTGFEQPASISIKNADNEEIILNDSNVKLFYNGNIEVPINAGTYEITARIEHDSYCGEITTSDNCVYTINKATVTFYILKRYLKQYGFNNGTEISPFADVEVLSSVQGVVPEITYSKDGNAVEPVFAENLTQSNVQTTYTVNVSFTDENGNYETQQSLISDTLYMITIPYSTLYATYNGAGNAKIVDGSTVDVYCNPNTDIQDKDGFLSLFDFDYDPELIDVSAGSVTVAGDWVINSFDNPIVSVSSQGASSYSVWVKIGKYIESDEDAILSFTVNIIKGYANIELVKSGNAVTILLDGSDAGSAAGSDIITYTGKDGEIAGEPNEMGNYHVQIVVNNSNFIMTTIDWTYSSIVGQLKEMAYVMSLEDNVYDGQAKNVTVSQISINAPSSIESYIKYYRIDNESLTALSSAPTDVGKYKAVIDCPATGEFKRYMLTYLFQIIPKQETPTISLVGTMEYNGNVKEVSISNVAAGKYEIIYFTWEDGAWIATDGENPIQAVGKYKVRVSSTDANYNILEEKTFVINKGKISYEVATSKVVYNGARQGIVLTYQGVQNIDSFYKYYTESGELVVDGQGDESSPINAGKYTVVVSFEENTYYDIIETFYIDKARADISITNTAQKYKGTELAASVSVPVSSEYTVYYSTNASSWSTGLPINAGNYFVKVELNDNSNYQGVKISQFVITPLEVNATITVEDSTYTGSGIGCNSVVVRVSATTILESSQYNVSYYNVSTGDQLQGSNVPTELGTYEARVVVTDTNYVLVSGGVERYTIIPRIADYDLSFTMESLTYTFSGKDQGVNIENITATVYKLNGGTGVNVISINASNYYLMSSNDITQKGTYIIKLVAANYQNGYFLVEIPKDNYVGSVSTAQLEASYVESSDNGIIRQNADGIFELKKSETLEYNLITYKTASGERVLEIKTESGFLIIRHEWTSLSATQVLNFEGEDGIAYILVYADGGSGLWVTAGGRFLSDISFERNNSEGDDYWIKKGNICCLITDKKDGTYSVAIDGITYNFGISDIAFNEGTATPQSVKIDKVTYNIYVGQVNSAEWELETYNIPCNVTIDGNLVKEGTTEAATIADAEFKLGLYEYTYYERTLNEEAVKAVIVSSVSIDGSVYSITWSGAQFALNKMSGTGDSSIAVIGSTLTLNDITFNSLHVGTFSGSLLIETNNEKIFIDVSLIIY